MNAFDDAESTNQLIILRSSRLEALVPQLMTLMATTCPDDVLAPQTLIAAHPGMKQWLGGAMAKEAGSDGVVANIDVILPNAWVSQVALRVLGEEAKALPGWQRKVLRWSILDALNHPDNVEGLSDSRVRSYLATDGLSEADSALRRYQLAHHLSAVFSQYLVYRSDWLNAWEKGVNRFATASLNEAAYIDLESKFLAPLWRYLAAKIGPHRALMVEKLAQALKNDPSLTYPIHVFGFSHLPPLEQAVLRVWAQHNSVFLYAPDPCQEYWGGLPAKADAEGFQTLREWSEAERERMAIAGGGEWLDDAQSHPLLQRWGRLGQHFFAGLAEWEAMADIRDHNDQNEAPNTRLARIQASIRQLDASLMAEQEHFPLDSEHAEEKKVWWQARRDDASLRIHSCHTRLRELEVLRDALLEAVESGIAPENIIVMAPDISSYAPMLPAIFGPPGDWRERRLPWHLADTNLLRSHRLFTTISNLLALGSSRVTLSDVAGWLAVPEIALALGLSDESKERLLEWLTQSRAAWALDASHRQSFGVPASHQHTMSWGLDRLLTGYVVADGPGEEAEHVITLPDESLVLPIESVHGQEVVAVGALNRLLSELQAWRDLSDKTLLASEWSTQLSERVNALFTTDTTDQEAVRARANLDRLLAGLGNEPAQAQQDPLLHFSVVREWLQESLEGVPERQRFLMGGITFCGMVPQRSIPFEMVCVLGLNDGDFPRVGRDGGIDLMARLRRLGDRDTRSDDRWLFLETVMAARQRLYLSWIGQSVRDGKPCNPAAPLAELMSCLDHAALPRLGVTAPALARPWLVEHPLQAFDARYFDESDKALYSYSTAFASMYAKEKQEIQPFVQGELGEPDPLPETLKLTALTHFWRNPAKDLLATRLGLDRSALESQRYEDSEPLDPEISRLERVAQRVFFEEALVQGFDDQGEPLWTGETPPDWVAHSGLLPIGELGRWAWRREVSAVKALLAKVNGQIAAEEMHTEVVDLNIRLSENSQETIRLTGYIPYVFTRHNDGKSNRTIVMAMPKGEGLKAANALSLGDEITLFLQWACLRLTTAKGPPVQWPAIQILLLAEEGDAGKTANEFVTNLNTYDNAVRKITSNSDDILADLHHRMGELIARYLHAAQSPPMYFPQTSKQAIKGRELEIAELAKALNATFESGFNSTGERDFSPGWAGVLMRGRGFDLNAYGETALENIKALVSYAEELSSLITPMIETQQKGATS